ncbi:MAG TPA: UPF0280 family protein [Thermohalobaculum sp.]|nr:UPF0280 family protein [Thermohalobaculum sp.]
MQRATGKMLPDGRRLHLHHGPIDLIIDVHGPGRSDALAQAIARFDTVLIELTAELEMLRSATTPETQFKGAIAARMQRAARMFLPTFSTPMAAVAGAVADEILAAMIRETKVDKAYVNNGGDVAFHLGPGQKIDAAIAAATAGRITIDASDLYRGIATSGWRGRSHSLGIADSVTVVARDAAIADVAATLIANAVDLPGHPSITRVPASELFADSDLGDRLVTTRVGDLTTAEVNHALDRGATFALDLLNRGLIGGVAVELNGQTRLIGAGITKTIQQGSLAHA